LQYPETPVKKLNYLPAQEQQLLLNTFNDTAADWGLSQMNLVSCFEQQVSLHPGRIALVSADRSLTFTELNNLSNQLANWLRSTYGISGNELIGIYTARNEYLLIGILGILKAGGAYVPLDPEYPADRLDYIIEDSRLKLILTDHASTLNN